MDAQAPLAPERQREQRRQKRARKRGEKIIERERSQPDAALGGQFQIEIVNGVHHFFDGEILADEVLTGPAKLFAQRGVAGKLQQAVFQAGQIAGLTKNPVLPSRQTSRAPSQS